jgi:hypothetical protein
MADDPTPTPPTGMVLPPPVPPRRTVMLAVLAGLLVGAAVIGATWWITSRTPDRSPADTDALAACTAVQGARVPTQQDVDRTDLGRWQAASQLADGASRVDGQYQGLADALSAVSHSLEVYDFGSRKYQDAAVTAQDLCRSITDSR